MASRKTKEKIGFKDIVTLAKSGWTPDEVNSLLDRMEDLGDINSPDPAEDEGDDEDEIDDPEDANQEESDEDEGDTDEDTAASSNKKTGKPNTSQDENKLDLLESENTRLKKQLEKLQKKNRAADVSGVGGDTKPIEEQLIDSINEIF